MQTNIKIVDIHSLEQYLHGLRLIDKDIKIVTTNGCFDILHRGHLEYLSEASEYGDLFIVLLNSDKSVKKLKGENRPVISEYDRAYALSVMEFVDFVVLFDDETPIDFIEIIKPDIHVKGGDYNIEELPETAIVKKYGGDVQLITFVEGYSTTSFIEKIKKM